MVNEIQKADMWKRISAWLFDGVLMITLAAACCMLLSGLLGFDGHRQTLEAEYARVEEQYGVSFDVTEMEYMEMSPEEQENYDGAYQALIQDAQAMGAYNRVVKLTLVMVSVGLLAAILIWEFCLPLLFGNGQTLGKKIFNLGLVRRDGVKLDLLRLFIRTFVGKYAIGALIPAVVLMMLLWGSLSLTGAWLLLGLLVGQVLCVAVTGNRTAVHDLLAGTVVVDISSQVIFSSPEELAAFRRKTAK